MLAAVELRTQRPKPKHEKYTAAVTSAAAAALGQEARNRSTSDRQDRVRCARRGSFSHACPHGPRRRIRFAGWPKRPSSSRATQDQRCRTMPSAPAVQIAPSAAKIGANATNGVPVVASIPMRAQGCCSRTLHAIGLRVPSPRLGHSVQPQSFSGTSHQPSALRG